MKKVLSLCFLLTTVLLTSCSTLQTQESVRSLTLNITLPDPERLRFSGKGAGAGMMLMSSMGPMGMAVGVAIDEGIGKNIEAPLLEEGFVFEQELRQILQAKLATSCCVDNKLDLVVERYGFKTHGRAEFSDPISPELKLKVQLAGQDEYFVDYPAKFEGELPLIPLEEAKVNGKISQQAMRDALVLVAEYLNQVLAKPKA